MKSWKRERILSRDGHRCRICGSEKHLRIFPLTEVPSTIPADAMPSVLHATLCRKCVRKVRKWNRGNGVSDPEKAMEEFTRVYHAGIHRAKDHLENM